MTIANTIANRAKVLADFQRMRAEIEARKVNETNYMLIWKFDGSSLFVGRRPKALDVGATGFGWAMTFSDFMSAQRYVERTNIRNGKGQQPVPVRVGKAREIALTDLDGVIATMIAMGEATDAKREG